MVSSENNEGEIPSVDDVTSTAGARQTQPEQVSDILASQEKTRSYLAYVLLGLLALNLLGIAVYLGLGGATPESKRELITLVWTSLVTLVSGALGFYFGSKN